jgi:glycoside/pentoside/hexuronide:cation symporter, GPH family
MSTDTTDPVSKRTKIAYAAPGLALAVVGIPLYVFIPKFYSDTVGINISLLGIMLLAVRVFDAVTDPAIGYLSDITRSKLGRRRPYMAIGCLALAVSILFLFNPPTAGPEAETLWFGFWIFSLFLFWTLVTVPYEALGPEITFDFHERTVLFAYRDGFIIAGTVLAATAPALIAWLLDLSSDATGERAKFHWMSLVYACLVVLLCYWCVLSVKERPSVKDVPKTKLFTRLRQVFSNRPFVILMISYTIAAFGSHLPATLILYYVQYVLQSQHADLFLLLYFVIGIAFLPAWVLLSKRIGKKAAWLSAIMVHTIAFAFVFFLGPGDEKIYGILVMISGIGFGATVALPSSMQADVIDYDELVSGERREGQYIGTWSVGRKLSAALGVGLALSLLGASGYEANVEQSEDVQLMLRVLYALVPSLCSAIAFVVALAYPISGAKHERILQAIEVRGNGDAATDPLNPDRRLPGRRHASAAKAN